MTSHHATGGVTRSAVAGGSSEEWPPPVYHLGGDGAESVAVVGEDPEVAEMLEIGGGKMGFVDVLAVSGKGTPTPASAPVDGFEAAGLAEAAALRVVARCDHESPETVQRCAILLAADGRGLMACPCAQVGFGRATTALCFLEANRLAAAGGSGGARWDTDSGGRASKPRPVFFVMLTGGEAADAMQVQWSVLRQQAFIIRLQAFRKGFHTNLCIDGCGHDRNGYFAKTTLARSHDVTTIQICIPLAIEYMAENDGDKRGSYKRLRHVSSDARRYHISHSAKYIGPHISVGGQMVITSAATLSVLGDEDRKYCVLNDQEDYSTCLNDFLLHDLLPIEWSVSKQQDMITRLQAFRRPFGYIAMPALAWSKHDFTTFQRYVPLASEHVVEKDGDNGSSIDYKRLTHASIDATNKGHISHPSAKYICPHDYTKKNANHCSSLSGVRPWLFFFVIVLLFGRVDSTYCQDCGRDFNYTWFCPVTNYQFKRYVPSIDGWISGTSLVLLEEQGTECKLPEFDEKECKRLSTSVQVASGFSAIFTTLATLGPLIVAYEIIHEIQDIDVTRRWLFTSSTFSFFSANFFWAFYLYKQKCRNDWTFVPCLLSLIFNFLHTVFFWCKASGRNRSRKNLLCSSFCIVGVITTACLVGCLKPRLAGGFGIFFTAVAHILGLLASGNSWSTINFLITALGVIGNCLVFHKINWKVDLCYKIGSIVGLVFRSLNMIMLLKLLFLKISAFCMQHFNITLARAHIYDLSNGGEPRSSESNTHPPYSTSSKAQNDQMGQTMPSSYNIQMSSSVNSSLPSPKEETNGNPKVLFETKSIETPPQENKNEDPRTSLERRNTLENGGIAHGSMYAAQLKQSPPQKNGNDPRASLEIRNTPENGGIAHGSMYAAQLKQSPQENGNEDLRASLKTRNTPEDGNDTQGLMCSDPKQQDNKDSGSSFEISDTQENFDKPHGVVSIQPKQGAPQNEEDSKLTKVSFESKKVELW